MSFKSDIVIIVLVVLFSIAFIPCMSLAATINVPAEYPTIQGAINAASAGDTIVVGSGTYYENVIVNQTVSLVGVDTGSGLPVVDGQGGSAAIKITADGVALQGFNATDAYWGIYVTSNYNNITGNSASHDHYAGSDWLNNGVYSGGIRLESSSYNNLSYNTASNDTEYGILLYGTSNNNTIMGNTVNNDQNFGLSLEGSCNCSVSGNTADDNGYCGILVENCHDSYGYFVCSGSGNNLSDNMANYNYYDGIIVDDSVNSLSGNIFDGNGRYGIWLETNSQGNVLENNAMSGNEYDFYDTSSAPYNVVDTSNLVEGKPIYYLVNASGVAIDGSSNAGTVYLFDCYNITVTGLTLTNDCYGIYLMNTTDSLVRNVSASLDGTGIYLNSGANDNTVTGNTAYGNGDGIYVGGSGNVVSWNTANSNHGNGIHVYGPGNTLTGNTANNESTGIELDNANYNAVSGNVLDNDSRGINVLPASNYGASGTYGYNVISGNSANNSTYGLYIGHGYYCTDDNNNITGNIFCGNKYGIYLSGSSNNNITGNAVNGNSVYGIDLGSDDYYGYNNPPSGNNVISDNNADNNGIGIYLGYYVSNTVVSGNTANNSALAGSYSAGISAGGSNNVVTGNIANGNNYGISLGGTGNNASGNVVDNNSVYGMDIYGSNGVVTANTADNNKIGFYIESGSNNIFSGNVAGSNKCGIYVSSGQNNVLTNNTMSGNDNNFGDRAPGSNAVDTSNLADGRPVYVLNGVSDLVLDGSTNAGTVYLVNCNNVTVRGLTLTNNLFGVYLENTDNSHIESVNASYDYAGIYVQGSNNTITGSTAINDSDHGYYNNNYGNSYAYGIYCSGSGNNVSGNVGDNDGWYGIFLSGSGYNVTGNVVANAYFGIILQYGSNSTIAGNTVHDITGTGIDIYNDAGDNVTGNVAYNDNNGISVTLSNGVVSGNIVHGNSWGLSTWGSDNVISGNTAYNNSYGIAYGGTNNSLSDNEAYGNQFGIYLSGQSGTNDASGNAVHDNAYGFLIMASCYFNVSGNTVSHNQYGIYMNQSGYGTMCYSNNVSGNTIDDNGYGIYLSGASSNNIYQNIIDHNTNTGIHVDYSSGNVFWLNNVEGNAVNAFCSNTYSWTNTWNSTVPVSYEYNGMTYVDYAGNYWGDYTGACGENGIGYTPYTISSNNIDHEPMMTEGHINSNFMAGATSGQVPFTVHFTDASTGGPSTWTWDFGDGSYSVLNGTSGDVDHTYDMIGDYTVYLTVENGNGTSRIEKDNYVNVTRSDKPYLFIWQEAPASALTGDAIDYDIHYYNLGLENATGVVVKDKLPKNVVFTSASDNGTYYGSNNTVVWKVQDLGTGIGDDWYGEVSVSGMVKLDAKGTLSNNASVTAKGGYNASNVKSTTVLITPKANFTADKTSGEAPLDVQFSDNSTGNPTFWTWDFGDGTTFWGWTGDVEHTYEMPGTYTVSMEAFNTNGSDSQEKEDYITVNKADHPCLYGSLHAPETVYQGKPLEYEVYYGNVGGVNATGVVLQVHLPDKASFKSASDGYVYYEDNHTLVYNIGTLQPVPNLTSTENAGSVKIELMVPDDVPPCTVLKSSTNMTADGGYNCSSSAETEVLQDKLPPHAGVTPSYGSSDGTPTVYWATPATFWYNDKDANITGVDITILVENDNSPQTYGNTKVFTGSMTAYNGSYWSYTTTFYPYHGKTIVTYTVHYNNSTNSNLGYVIYIDPSGYVYDLSTGERISGATVWLQWPNGNGGWANIPAGHLVMMPDMNPQLTGTDGQYKWDVLNGTYRVHVEAPGYYPSDSIAVNIPPPVTDLNVGLQRILDTTPPVTNLSWAGTAGLNGWYVSAVQVSLNASDIPINASDYTNSTGVNYTQYSFDNASWTTYTLPFNISDSGVTTLYYRSVDNAGNVEATQNHTFSIDLSQPAITGAATRQANANGWYNSSVVIHFTASDHDSGIQSITPNMTLSSNGAGQSVTGTAKDRAGNTASFTVTGINIDRTAPVVSAITASGNNVDIGTPISFNASFTEANFYSAVWDWGDGTSDAALINGTSVSGSHAYPVDGTYKVTLTVMDLAGNAGRATRTITVAAPPLTVGNICLSSLALPLFAIGSITAGTLAARRRGKKQ